MPRPSIGIERNARTFLNAFGEDITLQDNSVIQGIFKTRRRMNYETMREVTDYVLWIPEVLKGTFVQGQRLTARGETYYAVSAIEWGDDWIQCSLSRRPAG